VVAQQSQQAVDALQAANALLAEIKALKTNPQTAVPVTAIAGPSVIPTPPLVTSPTAVVPAVTVPAPAAVKPDTVDKIAEVLAVLTPAVQKLNTDIQNAPTTQAQQQAAINAGVQTAQAAAVDVWGTVWGADRGRDRDPVGAAAGTFPRQESGCGDCEREHHDPGCSPADCRRLASPPAPTDDEGRPGCREAFSKWRRAPLSLQ